MNNKIKDLRLFMKDKGIDLCLVLNDENQYYISNFKAIIYSRPIILGITLNNTFLIVPQLEEKHAKTGSNIDDIYVYYEKPKKDSSMFNYKDHLENILSNLSKNLKIGIESNQMSVNLFNYLKTKNYETVDISNKVKKMRFIKDDQEIESIKKSGELVSLAVKESLENVKVGVTEMELDNYGNKRVFEEISLNYPDSTLDLFSMSPSGVERTNMPHVFSNTRKLKNKDIVIHSRQVGLNGYRAECERTFFVGEPTKKQKEIFKVMTEAQQAAMDIIEPGISAKEVDWVARNIIKEANLEKYFIHRTGHGIGIGTHEEPYLRFDSDLTIKENMVFSIEPGIYIPEIGGFRHSDTIIVTENGNEKITNYPNELNDLIF